MYTAVQQNLKYSLTKKSTFLFSSFLKKLCPHISLGICFTVFSHDVAGLKRRCQEPGFRFQVPGVQVPSPRCLIPGAKCKMPGSMCQVPGPMCHTPGIRDQIVRDHVSDLRDQVSCQNVENLHIKNILRLNRNYKLILFSTEITNIQRNFSTC